MVLAFFNISGGELFIIVLVIFIIFGPDKIPEIARWMGKGINEIKRATNDIRSEIEKETGEITTTTRKLKQELNDEFEQLNPKIDLTGSKKSNASIVKPEEPGEPYTEPYNLNSVSDPEDPKTGRIS